MTRATKYLIESDKGSILMEFLLVAPVYLVLLGGLFSVNELVLLDNHVTVTDRNLSYDTNSSHLKESIWGTDSTGYTLQGKSAAEYDALDLYAPNAQGDSASAESEQKTFGSYRTSYITIKNQQMPSMIVGMRNAIVVLSGDDLDKYPSEIGKLPARAKDSNGKALCGRHFLLRRNRIEQTDRVPMYKVRANAGGETHYAQAVNYGKDWSCVGSKDIISTNAQKNSAQASQDGSTEQAYERIFQNFFSDMNR